MKRGSRTSGSLADAGAELVLELSELAYQLRIGGGARAAVIGHADVGRWKPHVLPRRRWGCKTPDRRLR